MIEITCRCGKSKKNFKVNIGPFFIDDCCLEAGYDELGNKKSRVVSQEEADKLEIVSQTNIVQNYGTGEIESIVELSREEVKTLNEDRKKRNYRRSGQVNIKKD